MALLHESSDLWLGVYLGHHIPPSTDAKSPRPRKTLPDGLDVSTHFFRLSRIIYRLNVRVTVPQRSLHRHWRYDARHARSHVGRHQVPVDFSSSSSPTAPRRGLNHTLLCGGGVLGERAHG